jgi:hypothetical protein
LIKIYFNLFFQNFFSPTRNIKESKLFSRVIVSPHLLLLQSINKIPQLQNINNANTNTIRPQLPTGSPTTRSISQPPSLCLQRQKDARTLSLFEDYRKSRNRTPDFAKQQRSPFKFDQEWIHAYSDDVARYWFFCFFVIRLILFFWTARLSRVSK